MADTVLIETKGLRKSFRSRDKTGVKTVEAVRGVDLKVYEGEILVPLKVRALPGAEKASEIRVRVRYQACNQQVCRRPAEVTVTAALPGQKGRE